MLQFYFNTAIFLFVDNEAPKLVCKDDQSFQTDEGEPTAIVQREEAIRVSDNSGSVSHVSCNPQLGTNFSIGLTAVSCEAVDESGNRAKCSFQVNVTGTIFTYCLFLSQIFSVI